MKKGTFSPRLLGVILTVAISAIFFVWPNNTFAQAGCSVSCSAQFFSDPGLENPVSNIEAISDTSFNVDDLYVAYEVCNDTTGMRIDWCPTSPDHPYQTGQIWCPPTNRASGATEDLQAPHLNPVPKNGRIYYVRRIPLSLYSLAGDNLDSVQSSFLANGTYCGSRSSVSVSGGTGESCTFQTDIYRSPDSGTNWQAHFQISPNGFVPGMAYQIRIDTQFTGYPAYNFYAPSSGTGNTINLVQSIAQNVFTGGTYTACVQRANQNTIGACSGAICATTFSVGPNQPILPPEVGTSSGTVVPGVRNKSVTIGLCDQLSPGSPEETRCLECAGDSVEASGVWTAFGCIRTNPRSIITTFMQIGLGLAGGVALIMILAAGFLFSTSQGDIKRTTEAKELITSAVIGLLFIIFSVVILQFIGVSILQIPGFGGP